MKRSSAELKKLARQSLTGKYGTFIGTYMIYTLIVFASSLITSMFFWTSNSYVSFFFQYGINFILSFVWLVFSIGFVYQALKTCRGETIQVSDLFYAFSHGPGRYLIVSLLETLIVLVLFIPLIAFAVVASMTGLIYTSPGLMVVVLLILFLIPYVLLFIFILGVSLTTFLLIDNPDMRAIEALKESWRLMKGHKGRLLYISLSFMGLTLLAMLSLGIGLLWVVPYMNVTTAYFYLDVIGELDSVVVPAEAGAPIAPLSPVEPVPLVASANEPSFVNTPVAHTPIEVVPPVEDATPEEENIATTVTPSTTQVVEDVAQVVENKTE